MENLEKLFLGKFGPKFKNCLFKVKFGTETKLDMPYSMVVLILYVLDWKCPFSANLVWKIKIVSLN